MPNTAIEKPKRSKTKTAARDKIIINWYVQGVTNPEEIASITGFEPQTVRGTISRLSLRSCVSLRNKIIGRKILEHRGPIMRAVASKALIEINRFLDELKDPEVRAARIRTVQDIKTLADLATNVTKLMRLEMGQSTENNATMNLSVEQTKNLFVELQKNDPVFHYPQLEELPSNGAITISNTVGKD